MAKVAFPSYDVQTIAGRAGGVGSFIVHLARQLRARGDEVTIIAISGTVRPVSVDTEWRERYRLWGIGLIEIHNEAAPERWPNVWTMTLSERVTPLLRDFDIVYFSDWGNVAFHAVRLKRQGDRPMPVCVTVLHGPSEWCRVLDGGTLVIPDDLHHEFVERYSAHHSDHVVAPSRYIADWVNHRGWQLTREPEILGLPFLPRSEPAAKQCAGEIRRLIYFARLERRKGFDLFVNGLLQLHTETPEILEQLDEVTLLGHEDALGAADWVRDRLHTTGLSIGHIGNFDSRRAQDFLAAHVADALVVVPSAFENFPYAVIEPSLIPGLNVICTRGGGTAEIFAGTGDEQLFDPTPSGLAAKIRERLLRPLKPSALAQYDFAAHNKRWLEFHDRVCTTSRASASVPAISVIETVDVCVTFFNKARYFPQLLESLELQTFQNFRVIAVDDGSTDPDAIAVFDGMAKKYRQRGWIFFRQSNAFVDAARNCAARRASADYLLFIDGDDVLTANAIERLLHAASHSGDDCLTPGILRFFGDQFPYDKRTGRPTTPIVARDMPLGPALTSAVVDPSVLGSSVILIRRSVFEAVGGYRELRGAAHEDWELQVKLTSAGYRTDVVPEYLYYYRQTGNSLSRNVDPVRAKRRVIEQFDEQLATVGLHGAATTLQFNLEMIRERKARAYRLDQQLRLSHERFNAFGFVPVSDNQPVRVAAPALPVPLNPIDRVQRIKVLVIIPTLNIGGAEMDLLRNLPRLDRGMFEIVVFTFLARGALAPQLAAAGIEIVGPFVALQFRWFRNLKRAALKFSRRLALLVSRSISALRDVVARTAPETARRAWRQLRLRLRLRFRQRGHRLRQVLSHISIVARQLWNSSRSELSRRLSSLIGHCKRLARFLPAPILRLFHATLDWSVYIIVGVALALFIRARRIDLIHTLLPNSYIVGSIANLCIARRPLIMSRVGLNSYQQRGTLFYFVERRLCHNQVSLAVANCETILDELRAEGIDQSKLRLIRNGIDIADFSWRMVDRDGARVNLGLPSTGIVISVVANLHGYKGHDDLLRGLHHVRRDMPEWILLVVGRDVNGNRARLETMCRELGILPRVRFLGERTDIPVIFSATDIHVSCSHTEGLPNNIIEAMCARLPVIATAVGGVREVLVDQRTGVLVPPHDPIELAQATLALARDGAARRRMGELGRERVAAHFAINCSVAAYERLYTEAVMREGTTWFAEATAHAMDIYAP